ncbi:hypothetical protein GCM10010433_26860 [Streptomyces pulveraceus]
MRPMKRRRVALTFYAQRSQLSVFAPSGKDVPVVLIGEVRITCRQQGGQEQLVACRGTYRRAMPTYSHVRT